MKRNRVSLFLRLLPVLLIFLALFRNWLSLGVAFGGDSYFSPFEFQAARISALPTVWNSGKGIDLGGNYTFSLWADTYLFYLPIFIASNGVSLALAQKMFVLVPLLLLLLFSPVLLFAEFFSKKKSLVWASVLVYSSNSYFLMLSSGGQIGLSLAYGSAPLVLFLLVRSLKNNSTLFLGPLFFALQGLFDLRLAWITYGIFILFSITSGNFIKKTKSFFLPPVVFIGLHAFWLSPVLLGGAGGLPENLSDFGWVEFLSFANFPQTISLLHPFWPENIFGKTYFMRPEFLVVPILAFSSLLFIHQLKSSRVNEFSKYENKKNKNSLINNSLTDKYIVLFFVILALVGAFLAKGSQPPFGGVYLWLFDHVPGFNMFRDASKFYLLVALSYSVLIPFALLKWTELIKKRCSKLLITNYQLPIMFLVYWLFLIRPAWLGQLGGTFKAVTVPALYQELADRIGSDDLYYRTFWVPTRSRFAYFDNRHPAVNSDGFMTDSVCAEPLCFLKVEMPPEWGRDCFPNDRCYVRELGYFLNPETEKLFQEMAVKYVIVPFDSQEEIFIAEHKYNPQQREEVEAFLDTIPWLTKVNDAGCDTPGVGGCPLPVWNDRPEKLAIYQVSNPHDHFIIFESVPSVSRSVEITKWKQINPTKYEVSVSGASQPFELVFSETFDNLWETKLGEKTISSQEYRGLNKFVIDQSGDYNLIIEYQPQKYVYRGGIISILTLIFCVGAIIVSRKKKK